MADPYDSTLPQHHYFHRCSHGLQYHQSTVETLASLPYAAAACPSLQMAQLPYYLLLLSHLVAADNADHTSHPDFLADSDALPRRDNPGDRTHASDKTA